MRRFLSQEIDSLVEELDRESSVDKRKKIIENFYNKNLKNDVNDQVQNYFGKLLTRLFIIINAIIIFLIIIYSGIDILFHIDSPEKRFIDGGVLGGLVTATIAEAVAAFIIFTRFVFK